jgi:hypothetical protein
MTFKHRYPENPLIERDFDETIEDLARLIQELIDLVDDQTDDDE